MPADPLDTFHAPVAAWFRDVFVRPTAVQQAAWEAISRGDNTLVVAPTGSGKTLAAFLWSLSQLTRAASVLSSPGEKTTGTKVLYISPLKALGVDVDRNLAAPLTGIGRMADALGSPILPVTVGVRSGDTPQAERARLLRQPPDILITTPESLYLMLTSKAAGTLVDVDTVIIDEIHAVAGTKRGSHLALSLERLELLTERPVQRIGLSATVNPVETVASYLGGDRPVSIVNPPQKKNWDVRVRSVVEDFQNPPAAEPLEGAPIADAEPLDEALLDSEESALPQQNSVWPHVQQAIYQDVMDSTSTLVFVNSRRTAERLTGALNELWAKEHDPESLAAPTRRDPAQLMAQAAIVPGAPAVIARAHHGSVAKDERADIEAALKNGQLRCVVATSSLELGIDMGLVDRVIQVGAPPSVAAAVQRCGRAGHAVGATSHATIYPLHKRDAEVAAVITSRLYRGELEPLRIVANALDVLAQQTVAAAVTATQRTGSLDIEQWWQATRRAYPFRGLPRDAFDGVIELISGRYPSTDFADLRARAVYDPNAGSLEARPGAQKVAVTSGGTIPDRGMFGVFLAAGDAQAGARRVGELDEEMVYESRVGDIFTLGASSWRITEITRDQVLVVPAAGHTGRLPFWTGDAEGRPVELGRAVGQARRAWGTGADGDLRAASYLDANTRGNLDMFYEQQKADAGVIPDEKTLLVEQFKDDLGDWRVLIHSPLGRGVNAPWALALGQDIERRTGIDAMAVAGDDGIVLRLPYSETAPGVELLLGDTAGAERADAVVVDVTSSVGSSALFASRFRECAARALLLPRRNPGKRQPLWQQRQRAAQLLDVAKPHPEFPIMVETMRECLSDVYRIDALAETVAALGERGAGIRVVEATTEGPSAFAESVLFNYTAAFMYEGDSALRASALAVDPALLAKVLGKSGATLELDPDAVAEVVAAAQWLAEGRRATSVEQIVDMLRSLGPLTWEDVAERVADPGLLDAARDLVPRRLMNINFGGAAKVAVVEDAALLRDGLGVPIPPGVAGEPGVVEDALEQLIARWLRHRGPTAVSAVASEFGLGTSTAHAAVRRLVQQRKITEVDSVADTSTYADAAMLRRLRAATLAAARGAIQPVSQATYAAFLQHWHGLGESSGDDLYAVIEQLAGVALPASAWETLILPARIPDYRPELLDELLASGEIHIVGAGQVGSNDSWVSLIPAELHAPQEPPTAELTQAQHDILAVLAPGGAFLATEIASALAPLSTKDLDAALWGLFDLGLVMPDSFAPLRRRLTDSAATARHKSPRSVAPRRGRTRLVPRSRAGLGNLPLPGRWALVTGGDGSVEEYAALQAEVWLDRHGVITRGAMTNEKPDGGFTAVYRNLATWEDSGLVIRGYIVEGLGGAQFATPAVLEQLRGELAPAPLAVLAATDPANPYGAALPWPADTRYARAAGAIVVLRSGELLAYIHRGGRSIETSPGAPVGEIIDALRDVMARGRLSPLSLSNINGTPAFDAPTRDWVAAGARLTPKGLVIRPPT